MKRPRINDFDPNAPAPLHSSMDQLPPIQRPGAPITPQPAAQVARSVAVSPLLPSTHHSSPGERPSVRAYARSQRARSITRYAFEFYQDQIDTLRHLALEEKAAGERGSMSEMVREALDAYIERRRQETEGA